MVVMIFHHTPPIYTMSLAGGMLCFRHVTQTFCSIIFAPVVYFMVGFSTADSGFRFFTFMVVGMQLTQLLAVMLQP